MKIKIGLADLLTTEKGPVTDVTEGDNYLAPHPNGSIVLCKCIFKEMGTAVLTPVFKESPLLFRLNYIETLSTKEWEIINESLSLGPPFSPQQIHTCFKGVLLGELKPDPIKGFVIPSLN